MVIPFQISTITIFVLSWHVAMLVSSNEMQLINNVKLFATTVHHGYPVVNF